MHRIRLLLSGKDANNLVSAPALKQCPEINLVGTDIVFFSKTVSLDVGNDEDNSKNDANVSEIAVVREA